MIARFTRFLGILLIALLAACHPQNQATFEGTDITGASFAKGLQLTDHKGQQRQLADFKGKVVALFFGYTHCPDVCPTTMSDLAKAVKLLGNKGDEVQVLFVTLDPERDTQKVLADYMPYFDQRFIGLYGTPEQTAETAKNFKITYSKQPADAKGNYTVDHSAGIYVFDKNGNLRVYLGYGQKPEAIAHDLNLLI